MGNVVNGNAPNQLEESEEWLHDLRTNRVLDFSRKVSHSQYLKHLRREYTDTSLTDVPWSILEYMNLYEKVDGSFNNISHISTNVALRIPHLTHLNLSYNSLTEIPPSIALLFHLEELLLRENKLIKLPEEMCLLPKLCMVDLSYNELQSLPRSIGNLHSLERLNVSHNSLTAIPVSLGLCQKLVVILASNNNCVNPPQQVCNSSTQLLLYVKSNAPEILIFKKLNNFPRIRSNVARSQLDENVSSYVKTLTQTSTPSIRAKTPLLLPPNATQCSPEDLRDKIIGLVYGAVIGDSLGMATEYLSADEIDFYYGGGRLDHSSIVQDEHRSHFLRGKTTCVSDFMLLIFDSILQWSGVLDELELAQKLIDYSVKGIKDLNAQKPFITSTIVNRLLSQERFSADPHMISKQTALEFNGATCEDLHALPMAIISALPQFYSLPEVQSNATRVCRTTHNHPRVIQCTCTLATISALLLQGWELDKIKEIVNERTQEAAEERKGLKKDELELVMESAIACLEEGIQFEASLTQVLFRGGQSRIFGTVCGGILGMLNGYTRLPPRWINGLHPTVCTWLNERINHLLDMMGLP